MFKDIAKLIYATHTQDGNGFDVEAPVEIDVFVDKKSVTRSEFYAAMKAEKKPSIMFDLRVEDWELSRHIEGSKVLYADKIEYDSGTYNIIRSYEKGGSMIELTCG
jgi:hypothetical protein